jgi:hypothetical protein
MTYPIINPGSLADKASIELATKLGNHIPNEQRKELIPSLLLEGIALYEKNYNIQRRSLTATYNCLGMVFGVRRTFIDDTYLDWILKEDGYKSLSDISELEIGDLIIYRNNGKASHVGVVVDITRPLTIDAKWIVQVMSKWGAGGEYIHSMEIVHPFLGKPSEFWTDRKEYGKA